MDIRKEFEKLEEVAARIGCGIYWNEYQQKYQTDLSNLSQTVCYLNGAWYAFQEQQKKIDICESLRDSQFNKLWNLTQAIERARVGADEDFDLFLNHLSNTLKGE